MPAQKGKSAFAAKVGAKAVQAIQTHAGDETNYGLQRLPGGINGGVAQLTKCYFAEYKSGDYVGQYYFRAEGVVHEPRTVATPDGVVVVRGGTTSIMIPVCDTRNSKGETTSQDEHIAAVLNEMRKLGADTSGVMDPADLEQLAADLAEAKPFFKFSTSVGQPTPQYPTPRVWENWHGTRGVEEYQPEDAAVATADNTAKPKSAPAANGKPTAPPVNRVAKAAPPPEPEPESEVEYRDDEDLDSLGRRAQAGDEAAQTRLQELAAESGVPDDQVAAADDWNAVVELLRGGAEAAGDEAAAEPELAADWVPEKGEIYGYRPEVKGPGGKVTRAKKSIDVEVMAVDKKNKTVTVADTADKKKVWQKVPWVEMESAT